MVALGGLCSIVAKCISVFPDPLGGRQGWKPQDLWDVLLLVSFGTGAVALVLNGVDWRLHRHDPFQHLVDVISSVTLCVAAFVLYIKWSSGGAQVLPVLLGSFFLGLAMTSAAWADFWPLQSSDPHELLHIATFVITSIAAALLFVPLVAALARRCCPHDD